MKTLMAVLMLLVSTSLLADPNSNALEHANCNASLIKIVIHKCMQRIKIQFLNLAHLP